MNIHDYDEDDNVVVVSRMGFFLQGLIPFTDLIPLSNVTWLKQIQNGTLKEGDFDLGLDQVRGI